MSATSALLQRITIDPEICHGKPCIRGLRYPVESMLELMSSGMTWDDILADYPDLETADLQAVLAYAAILARTKSIALATGNISNNDLLALVRAQLQQIQTLLSTSRHVEITRNALLDYG